MNGDERPRPADVLAARLGHGVGRLRRRLKEAQPQAEEVTRRALEAARPAAERAREFVREHEDEIRQAGLAGARALAQRAAPRRLRPVISALDRQLSGESVRLESKPRGLRKPPPDRDDAGG